MLTAQPKTKKAVSLPFLSPLDATRGDSEYDGEVDDRGREVEEAEHREVVLGVSLVEPESERVPAGAAASDDADNKKKNKDDNKRA